MIVQIKNLTKIYKGASEPAIDNISFNIEENEIFGLLGPNGAGKTTTISIISSLLKPTEGDVSIAGYKLGKDTGQIKQLIGVVPQDIALYSTLTARENLRFYGKMYGKSGKELENRINECLVLMGLENSADRKIKTYSTGMKRRVNLIAGILHNPKILILDEPTVGIDVQSRKALLDYLKTLHSNGMTILYTSHYLEEVENLCHSVLIVDKGKIIAQHKTEELLKNNTEHKNLESYFIEITGKEFRD